MPTMDASDFGAPIMQIVTGDGHVIAMEGFEDVSALQQNTKFMSLIDQFLKERDSLWEHQKQIEQHINDHV